MISIIYFIALFYLIFVFLFYRSSTFPAATTANHPEEINRWNKKKRIWIPRTIQRLLNQSLIPIVLIRRLHHIKFSLQIPTTPIPIQTARHCQDQKQHQLGQTLRQQLIPAWQQQIYTIEINTYQSANSTHQVGDSASTSAKTKNPTTTTTTTATNWARETSVSV